MRKTGKNLNKNINELKTISLPCQKLKEAKNLHAVSKYSTEAEKKTQ